MSDSSEAILITGGYGCIGAETTNWLLSHSRATIIVGSRTVTEERSTRIFGEADKTRLLAVELDVRDGDAVERCIKDNHVTRVVHLGALQTPDCNDHRNLGLQINLAGTQNLIEAIKGVPGQVKRFVFASSVAVYGPRNSYPSGTVPMLAAPNPVNVYGAWKLAGEHISRIFHEETGVSAVSIRPGVLYGPGRDAGLTSTPTTAMKCVALGLPYKIPYRSRQDYLYAPDVGAAFASAATEAFSGYGCFTLPAHTANSEEFLAKIEQGAARLGIGQNCQITVGDEEVPFICDLDYKPFNEAFPGGVHTALGEGIERSLNVFVDHVQHGWLKPETLTL